MEMTSNIEKDSKKYKFILFVSGMSFKSMKAIENIGRICETYLKENFELEIIDVSKDPGLAVDYQLIGLPTLIKVEPTPTRVILGDLSDTNKVLKILTIEQQNV